MTIFLGRFVHTYYFVSTVKKVEFKNWGRIDPLFSFWQTNNPLNCNKRKTVKEKDKFLKI